MKSILIIFTAAAFVGVPVLTAQVTETRTKTQTTQSADGTASESSKTTVTTFNPEARTKVVEYFNPYKASPYGLPPAFASRVKVKELPPAWRTAQIQPGVVITETQRPYLVEAPPELVRVLPPPPAQVRYYVAGGSVVAVNSTYQVVDSIRIPSVKFESVEAVPVAPAVEVVPVAPPVPAVPQVKIVEEVETVKEIRK